MLSFQEMGSETFTDFPVSFMARVAGVWLEAIELDKTKTGKAKKGETPSKKTREQKASWTGWEVPFIDEETMLRDTSSTSLFWPLLEAIA